VSLTSPQQVGKFPAYGKVTGKRVWWIFGISLDTLELIKYYVAIKVSLNVVRNIY